MEIDKPQKGNPSNTQPHEQKVYEELKGYFPEQYDLTPQELEESIRQHKNVFNTTEQVKISCPLPPSLSQEPLYPSTDELSEYAPPDLDKDIWGEALPIQEVEKKSSIIHFLSEAFDILEVFALCAACIILVFAFVARLTRVDGISMNETLQNGEFLVVSNLFYTPKQGDIVVLHNTSLEVDKLREPLVKRIIAVGGQTVTVDADGTVTITDRDGTSKVLDQSFIKQEPYNKNTIECYVPDGYIFVMGDNRNNSTDSRDMRVGLIDERCICGRAILRVFPFNAFSTFKNPLTEQK